MWTRARSEAPTTIAVRVVPVGNWAPAAGSGSASGSACPAGARPLIARLAASAASVRALSSSPAVRAGSAVTASSDSIAPVLADAPPDPKPSATASTRVPAWAASWFLVRTRPVSQRDADRTRSASPASAPCSARSPSSPIRTPARSRRAAVSASTRAQKIRTCAAACAGARSHTVRICARGMPSRRSHSTSRARSSCSTA